MVDSFPSTCRWLALFAGALFSVDVKQLARPLFCHPSIAREILKVEVSTAIVPR
jgi:hypothetical protein